MQATLHTTGAITHQAHGTGSCPLCGVAHLDIRETSRIHLPEHLIMKVACLQLSAMQFKVLWATCTVCFLGSNAWSQILSRGVLSAPAQVRLFGCTRCHNLAGCRSSPFPRLLGSSAKVSGCSARKASETEDTVSHCDTVVVVSMSSKSLPPPSSEALGS